MNCAESLELLSEYYEEALETGVKIEVRTHLVTCLTCADVYHDLEIIVKTSTLLRSDEFIVFPDENVLWQRIDQATH